MKKIFLFYFFLFFLFWIYPALSGFSQDLESSRTFSKKTILVLPFEYYCPTEKAITFFCPVQGIISGEIEGKAKEIMNSLLRENLKSLENRYTFIFLSQEDYEILLEEALNSVKTSEELVEFFSKKTGAHYLLYGKIFKFKERRGKSWSVESPAAVAFTLVLYKGEDGKILWQRTFDEVQKPLSENLLKLSLYKKIKWLTAEELSERGLQEILKSFP